MAKRLTRYNGRAGKSGVYKSTHNDRTFDTERAEHIDSERISQNIYWDCFRGATYPAQQDSEVSFADVERAFYLNRYSDYLDGQHERNAKRRHSERDRSVDDLLADKRFCPEETIYQIGTIEDSVSPDVLLEIVGEFMMELERRFGEHIHVIDWALHLDEATPHIHERHVFDYVNRYGEIEPKQEKALEALGFELPDPGKKAGRTNCRNFASTNAAPSRESVRGCSPGWWSALTAGASSTLPLARTLTASRTTMSAPSTRVDGEPVRHIISGRTFCGMWCWNASGP